MGSISSDKTIKEKREVPTWMVEQILLPGTARPWLYTPDNVGPKEWDNARATPMSGQLHRCQERQTTQNLQHLSPGTALWPRRVSENLTQAGSYRWWEPKKCGRGWRSENTMCCHVDHIISLSSAFPNVVVRVQGNAWKEMNQRCNFGQDGPDIHPRCTLRVTHVPCSRLRQSRASPCWHQWMLDHISTLSPTSPHHVRAQVESPVITCTKTPHLMGWQGNIFETHGCILCSMVLQS